MLDRDAELCGLDWSLDGPLKQVGLIGEIPITDADLELLSSRLRDCLRSKGHGPGTEYLEDHGARVVACFLVHLGVREYREGDFWPYVTRKLRCDLTANLQVCWGKMVEQVIERYRLPRFYDPLEKEGLRYVTPILGHGGIPEYCLNDFFEKLLLPVARGRLTYEGDVLNLLQQWQERASDYLTADKPIRRFLRHGGKVARDFLDRCLRMVETFDDGRADDGDWFRLPGRVAERYGEWFASRHGRSFGQGARVSSGPRYQRPELYFDPAFGGLRLAVPRQSIAIEAAEQGRLTVFVRQDDVPRGEFPLRPASVNGTVDTLAIDIPLRRTFAKLDVVFRAGPKELRKWDFDGITDDRPWMAFDGQTGRILTERPLPKGDVWLLAPTTTGLVGGDASEEVPVWGEFLARRVDLGTSDDWRLDERRDGLIRATHPIEASARTRPCFVGDRLPDWPAVSCPGCDSVFAGAPDLVFPTGLSGPEGWRDATLTVRSLDDNAPAPTGYLRFLLSDLLMDRPGPDREIRLPLGKPPLSLSTGRFLVNLRGRLGQDEAYRIAVIPAMDVECPTACLYPDGSNEPSPVPIRILMQPGILVEPYPGTDGRWEADDLYRIDLGTQQRSVELKVQGVGLRITLPRVEWAFSEHDEAMVRFDSSRIEIGLPELQSAAEPILRLKASPGWESDARLELDLGGQSCPVKWRQGLASVPLNGFLDTIRAARGPLARFQLVFSQGDDERRLEVLRIRRRWSCRLRSAETEITSGSRALFFAWDDQVALPNRIVRLWRSVDQVDHPAAAENVEDHAEEMGFDEPAEVLPDGRYLVDFDTRDDDGWFSPAKPHYFKVGVQVIQLDASSVGLLGSPAERLGDFLGTIEGCGPVDPALRDRVLDDILAEPVSAEQALRDRGWASLKALFAAEGFAPNSCGGIEDMYGAISWSRPRFAVAFLRRLKVASGRLECQEGKVLDVELDDGNEYPVAIRYLWRERKGVFNRRYDEGRKCVVAANWCCTRPSDWSPEVERFVLSWFQRALGLGIASCHVDVRTRIEEMARQAFLSDPDDYLRALVDADKDLSH